jgi:hypothetical protein
VKWCVEYGLLNRIVSGAKSIGVDEIHWGHSKKADNFLTVIYQIDAGCKRLLSIGKRRAEQTLLLGLKKLGSEFVNLSLLIINELELYNAMPRWRTYSAHIASVWHAASFSPATRSQCAFRVREG